MNKQVLCRLHPQFFKLRRPWEAEIPPSFHLSRRKIAAGIELRKNEHDVLDG
jgi:hypothetical protein